MSDRMALVLGVAIVAVLIAAPIVAFTTSPSETTTNNPTVTKAEFPYKPDEVAPNCQVSVISGVSRRGPIACLACSKPTGTSITCKETE